MQAAGFADVHALIGVELVAVAQGLGALCHGLFALHQAILVGASLGKGRAGAAGRHGHLAAGAVFQIAQQIGHLGAVADVSAPQELAVAVVALIAHLALIIRVQVHGLLAVTNLGIGGVGVAEAEVGGHVHRQGGVAGQLGSVKLHADRFAAFIRNGGVAAGEIVILVDFQGGNGLVLHSLAAVGIHIVGACGKGAPVAGIVHGVVFLEHGHGVGTLGSAQIVGVDRIAQVEVQLALIQAHAVGQAGVLLGVNEVPLRLILQNRSLVVLGKLAGAVIEQGHGMGIGLGVIAHHAAGGAAGPVIRGAHGTALQLIGFLHVHALAVDDGFHVELILHVVHLVDLLHAAAQRSHGGATVNIVPVGSVVVDAAHRTTEPGILIAGVVVLGLVAGLHLVVLGMGGVVVLLAGVHIFRRNDFAVGVLGHLVHIAVVQRIDVVNGLALLVQLGNALGGHQEVGVVNAALDLAAVLGHALHIDVVIANVGVEPLAVRLVVGIGQARRVHVVHVVECAAAEALAGHAGFGGVGIELGLDEVHQVVIAHLGGGLPNGLALVVGGLVHFRMQVLQQIGVTGRVAQADGAVVGLVHGVAFFVRGGVGGHLGQLVAEQRAKGGHLDGVGLRVAAGAGNVGHHAHIKGAVVGQPVVQHQLLLDLGGAFGQVIHHRHGLVAHGQQLGTVVVHIGHQRLGQHLHQLDHLSGGHLRVRINVAQYLHRGHGVGIGVLGGPVIARDAQILGVVRIEGAQHGVVALHLQGAVVPVVGVQADHLALFVGLGRAVLVHTEGIVHVSGDLHIGVEQIVVRALAVGGGERRAVIHQRLAAGLGVHIHVLVGLEVGQRVGIGDLHGFTAHTAGEGDLGQIVGIIRQDALGDLLVLRIVEQAAVLHVALIIGDGGAVRLFFPLEGHFGGDLGGLRLPVAQGHIPQHGQVGNGDLAVAVHIRAQILFPVAQGHIPQHGQVGNGDLAVAVQVALVAHAAHGVVAAAALFLFVGINSHGGSSLLNRGLGLSLGVHVVQLVRVHRVHSGGKALAHVVADAGHFAARRLIGDIGYRVVHVLFVQGLVQHRRQILHGEAQVGHVHGSLTALCHQGLRQVRLDRIVALIRRGFHTLDERFVLLLFLCGDPLGLQLLCGAADQVRGSGKGMHPGCGGYLLGLEGRGPCGNHAHLGHQCRCQHRRDYPLKVLSHHCPPNCFSCSCVLKDAQTHHSGKCLY